MRLGRRWGWPAVIGVVTRNADHCAGLPLPPDRRRDLRALPSHLEALPRATRR